MVSGTIERRTIKRVPPAGFDGPLRTSSKSFKIQKCADHVCGWL
jgi:hypothetical protein